jgi:hypothetical protein
VTPAASMSWRNSSPRIDEDEPAAGVSSIVRSCDGEMGWPPTSRTGRLGEEVKRARSGMSTSASSM